MDIVNGMMRFSLTGFIAPFFGVVAAMLVATPALAQVGPSDCGPLSGPGQYGPFDYRNQKSKIGVVEQHHFKPHAEHLTGDLGYIAGNIDYTLRAVPNHHRALLSMVKLGEKLNAPHPKGATYSVDCYFERALRFRRDDVIVRMIYATYLAKNGRLPEALGQLKQATDQAGDYGFTHYNIGLVYFDLKEYDKALVQAHKAVELGWPQTALGDQLKAISKWVEPPDATGESAKPAAGSEPAGAASPTPGPSSPSVSSQ